MDKDLFIFIAFCVFMFMAGMRLRQRFKERKQEASQNIQKNQRSKMARMPEDPEMMRKRINREKRIRRFTILQMVILFALMILMIPVLTRDIASLDTVNITDFVLRSLIFIFSIYIFVFSYIKVFGKKKEQAENQN
ncbi:MAG: hypothetical protein ACRDDZ_02290 [Marinifilaceae bacterium]